MNDETLELLSAYLDGALPEAARLALEARLAASADLRRELEELRAVSKAVKELPKQPLPPGFLARLQARRARGDAPRDWVFLPPSLRPAVLALSCGAVALMIWGKVAVAPPEAPLHPRDAAPVTGAANAPASQFDVSGLAAGNGGAGQAGRDELLPALELKEETAAPAGAKRAARGRAAGQPYETNPAAASAPEPALTDRTMLAMTEEERSAKNERMFGYIEQEKKKLGIAKVLPKSGAVSAARGAALAGAPAIGAPAPTLLKQAQREGPAASDAALQAKAEGSGRLSPDAGLVFSDARSLASSWVLLGFPGNPPATDFSAGRLVLIKPSATKIVSVTADAAAVRLSYRTLRENEAPDPAKDRVAPIPAEPKTVLFFDASPR
jgi:anti-sigma factor RsiW